MTMMLYTSVTLKIEELQKEPFNPVLLYKQQGCSSSSQVEVFAAVTYFKVLLCHTAMEYIWKFVNHYNNNGSNEHSHDQIIVHHILNYYTIRMSIMTVSFSELIHVCLTTFQ